MAATNIRMAFGLAVFWMAATAAIPAQAQLIKFTKEDLTATPPRILSSGFRTAARRYRTTCWNG